MNTIYQTPDTLWHVRIDGHELRQHYFTREAALVRLAISQQRERTS